jgi:CubicO group peptidase (beta-lactamase class C family)
MKDKILTAVNKLLPHFTDMHGEIAVSCGDDILYHEGFTYADAPWSVGKNSQYLVGSVTKQFTAAALLKSFYDRHIASGAHHDDETLKKLIQNDLHSSVSYFLSQEHQIWGGHMPNWANMVTIHHLLTHTSGIKKKNETVFDDSLDNTPGQQFLYSNPNYVLIGNIISEITKTSLDDYYKHVLFNPAGMKNTGFPLTGTPKRLNLQRDFKKLAVGFEYDLVPLEITFRTAEEKITFNELSVAGGIVSTVKDCIKWNNALYHGKIIPRFLVELMLKKYISSAPVPIYYGLDPVWYGYGIDVYDEDQKICYQHPGGCPGYQSRLIYLPVSNVTIVHLSNSQKDNTNYNNEKNKISVENQCDDITAERIFNEQFPHYKSRIQSRMNIFDFANELRSLFM